MPRHQEKRILPYTPQQMFDLVAGIEHYPDFLPWCRGARIKERKGDTVTADLIIGYALFRERFTSVVTLDRPNEITVKYISGPLSHLSNQWRFRAEGKGCEIGFLVDFDFRSPILSGVADIFFDKVLSKMVAAFEARARQIYG